MLGFNSSFAKILVDLSKYEIGDEIGEGNFGVVKKGVSPEDPKHPKKSKMNVAIKFLKSSKDKIDFIREVGCQASLNHTAILPLIGFSIPFTGPGHYAIVTPYMPNVSLSELISRVGTANTPKNWETIKAINIFGIAAGMAYVNQHKILHKNLKTENIMLDSNNYPKIADFVISPIFEEGTIDYMTLGLNFRTTIYMAPEFLCDPQFANKNDVFAYSFILYELLTGNKPYSDKAKNKEINVLNYICKGLRPTIHPNEISEDYAELINRCWDDDPNSRPRFIQIVKDLMDFKEHYFDMSLIDEDEFSDYVEDAIKGLDFSEVTESEEEEKKS